MPDTTTTAPGAIPAPAPTAPPAANQDAINAAIEALALAQQAVLAAQEMSARASGTPLANASRPRFDMTKPRVIEPVPIELDRTRHLILPMWALMDFEEKTGISPWDTDKILKYPPDLKLLSTFLWEGLREEDPDLTIDQVRKMKGLDWGNVYYILHCLDLCWGTNAPEPEKPSENGQGTGKPDPNPRPRSGAGPTG
jgi:hypothetical protein